ncbi:hypothetical protein NQ318_023291, partial [Aromia moschata]
MLESTEILIVTISVVLIALVRIIDKKPPPIIGIYQRPSGLYWLKVGFMYLLLTLRKLKPLKKKELERFYSNIEKPQKLSVHEKPIDAVYLNGANKHGDHLVTGLARRKGSLTDGFLYLKINGSNYGLLETPKLPDTTLRNDNDEEFSADGIKMSCVEPMKKWTLMYNGKMKELDNRNKWHDVTIEGVWTSDLPPFNFDTDMDPLCMAKSMAYEKWSRQHFDNLKSNHQTHYEQFGVLRASVKIDDVAYDIELDTLRDHSFGNHREWRQFRRYGLHFFSAENGDRFSLGKICLPISFSRLTVGYVYSAKHKQIFPVKDCDLQLYQHGEFGTPPKDFAFSFTA